MEHPPHIPKKRTMMKDRVGCVRASTYNLPQEGHTYGAKTPEAAEGAGNIISNWVTANPSLEKKSSKLIVYSNVLAVKHGCITSTSMRQYSIDHPNIRMKEVLNNDSTRVDANHEGPFGIKTKFSEEPIGDILQAKYTNFANEDSDYPSVVSIKKVGFMPSPRPTIASQSQMVARMRKAEKDKPKHFIMKRFQNIQGKMSQEREAAAKMRASMDFEAGPSSSGPEYEEMVDAALAENED
mmetsp:Transcript_1439/g.2343  ORF Transcript_1439/g.2343 Transcript_1439/m.2343 type:complete len:239 (+) Transcript_1439:223-939(+)|eukprot:CAMPEP_0174973502 /NCGR_PEP_ID=MMETSP0004_2-20121128/11278_1 /TAXON_ID=420556 /ORGANISM="Ochromonas sp., Strain CCMP1393" /LENGTH=238 /DNA_ID=CAMNT_0016223959 /DNA_START=209 /DNA_END=925 /DNA_ORIENTATION=-